MNISEIKIHLRNIADQLIEDVDGLSYMQVADAFKATTNPEDLIDLGAEALDDLIRRYSKDIVDLKRRSGNGQLSFEGIGEFDDTVTTVNAEGAYIVKRLKYATMADLLADERLHEENVATATKALERARKRNFRIVPLMEDNGYETAGEALELLEQLAAKS